MSACQRFETMIESLASSELDSRELSSLLAHTRECESCRGLLSLHGDLTEAAERVPQPDDAELDLRQERVLRVIAQRRSRRPLRVALFAASLILPFVAGVLAGRASGAGSSASGRSSRLIDALHAEAASNGKLAAVEESPFTYSTVSWRRVGEDRVALDFDVTTHLSSTEPLRSPLVNEVLAQSLLNPSSVGERLKTMSFAASELDPKLEQAVLFSLRHDESVAVRLAALTVLVGRSDDEDVQSGLMTALHDDPSVQVRLAALESLAARRVDHGRIREAIRGQKQPGDEALMVRLAELERQR